MDIIHPTIHIDDEDDTNPDESDLYEAFDDPAKVIREDDAVPLPEVTKTGDTSIGDIEKRDVPRQEDFLKDSISKKMWEMESDTEKIAGSTQD